MDKTIEYYNKNAHEFCENTVNADMSYCRDKFLALVKPGGRILDAGCGSGRDSHAFIQLGYEVEAFDASPAICEEASRYVGKQVRCMRFQDMEYDNEFDGIWACASLLHVSRNEIDCVMEKLKRALKSDGVLYCSFKYGEAEREKGDRSFYDYSELTLEQLLIKHDFSDIVLFITGDVRDGRERERWMNAICVMRVR